MSTHHVHERTCARLSIEPLGEITDLMAETRTLSRMLQGLIARVESEHLP